MAPRRASSQEHIRSLTSGPLAPVYLFHGEEEYLIEQAVTIITKRAVGDTPSGFDFDVVSFSDMSLAEVLARASSYPMSAEKRVVVARDLDRVLGKAGKAGEDPAQEGEGKAAALKSLLDFIVKPLQTTCLILTAGKKLDGRLKPIKELQDRGAAFEFAPLYDSEIPSWIASRVQAAGRAMDDDACQLLATYVGTSLYDISSEIEKLLIYTVNKASIAAEDVAALVGVSREFNVFELQRAVGSRDLRRGLTILENMLNAGQSGPYLIVMLTNYFARLWKMHALFQRFRDERKVMEEMQVAPFVLRELRSAGEHYSATHVTGAFRSLVEADLRLKTGAMEERTALDALIVQLIAGR